MSPLYGDDLAFIQAAGFGELAAGAIAALVPRLRAAGVRRVLDIGCGAGVTTRALIEAEFETVAIEPSSALLALARAAAPAARFVEASVYETPLPSCDAILALGEPLTYHDPHVDAQARLKGFFAAATVALDRGGLLIFDLIVTGDPPLDARGWRAGDDWAILFETREDSAHHCLVREIETFRRTDDMSYRRTRERHDVKVFDERTVVTWLEAAGFQVTTARAYGTQPLGPRRVAFTATRV